MTTLWQAFTFRPDNEDEDWADNWISNAMAYVSKRWLPQWCATPDHWTSRLTDYFFTDCPCCLLLRGIFIGFLISFVIMCAFVLTIA